MKRSFKKAAIPLLIVVALFGCKDSVNQHQAKVADQHLDPILIQGVQEPEEMKVEPFPFHTVSQQEQMLGDAMKINTKNDAAAMLSAYSHIIEKYPDYADAYILRLGELCNGNDRAAILSDINNALKYISGSQIGKDSSSGLLSMRAKIEHSNGDDAAALKDLDKSINDNVADAERFTNSGAVAPETNASLCIWTAPDMDALVQSFPSDYRTHIFRGLYYGFFVTYKEGTLRPALDNFNKAVALNPNSALPHYFIAKILEKAFFFKRMNMSEVNRNDLNNRLLEELNKALAIDPKLKPALSDRAQVYFELKQWQNAIADYDRIVALDTRNYGAYNDRGLAKMQLGNMYEAISDFNKAIEFHERKLQDSTVYESRAEAYIKNKQWDLAIHDLSTAISLNIGAATILMDIDQFRTFYPEYKAATDEAITNKLKKTFYPQLKYDDSSKGFMHDHERSTRFISSILHDLYLKRSDAYLQTGDWHRAFMDFHRVVNGMPTFDADRWREFGSSLDVHYYIDLKTFDDTNKESVKLWVKHIQGREDTGPYSLQQYELNCSEHQMREVSFANYDKLGNIKSRHGGDKWESIIPDTLGETLQDGICHG